MATLKNTTISGTGSIQLPVGVTTARPSSPVAGQIRYNSTFKLLETYNGTSWISMPDIVRDSLVLHLNAGEPSSYPGTGTTWTDLSGNGITGTLTNGPTYNSSDGGYISFDGSNDMVVMANNTQLDTQTPTVEVWVKTNSTNQAGFWFEKGTVNTQYSLFQEGTNIQWRQTFGGSYSNLTTDTATYMNTTSWYQVVGTYRSGQRRLYINGVLVNSDAGPKSGTIDTNSGGMSIGVYGGFAGARGYYYNGNLAICRIYSKVLTKSEVARNYLATKSRFGL